MQFFLLIIFGLATSAYDSLMNAILYYFFAAIIKAFNSNLLPDIPFTGYLLLGILTEMFRHSTNVLGELKNIEKRLRTNTMFWKELQNNELQLRYTIENFLRLLTKTYAGVYILYAADILFLALVLLYSNLNTYTIILLAASSLYITLAISDKDGAVKTIADLILYVVALLIIASLIKITGLTF